MKLIAMMGPPGAGKSSDAITLARQLGAERVNLDTCRAMVGCCPANQAATPMAIAMAQSMATSALSAGRSVVWDATSADRCARGMLLTLAAQFDAHPHLRIVLPALDTVLRRNDRRDATRCYCGYARRVPADIVITMHEAITAALADLHLEGWKSITLAG